jgi:hypothetical protein
MAKRYFNTSGPNIQEEHYTIMRDKLIQRGLDLVNRNRYFTIWAPRQSGKTTYFRLLARKILNEGYQVIHINVENFQDTTKERLFEYLDAKLQLVCGVTTKCNSFADFFNELEKVAPQKCVLIVDEIEGLNVELFNQFLDTIRLLYHFRYERCLQSVILVGVCNITGVVEDSASPFNIANTLEIPFFTREEVYELISQHQEETGQRFDEKVKEKIFKITAGHPGLVNGFAYKLVEQCEGNSVITYDDYLEVEDWYNKVAIDKNVANIINMANKFRHFVERILFKEEGIEFDIERESIKLLHINGIIKRDKKGYVEFRVPLYKKKLFRAFYPHQTCDIEKEKFFIKGLLRYINKDKTINFDKLIGNFKDYVKERGFGHFRQQDEITGLYQLIKEAALVYAFESYIQTFIQSIEGKSYLEPYTGAGKSDLIVNVNDYEYVIEVKIYRDEIRFENGKKQLANYCNSIKIKEGIYLVFAPKEIDTIVEKVENIKNVQIRTYIIGYDEEKDF